MPLDPAPTQDITLNDLNKFTQRWIAWFNRLLSRINNTNGWAYYQDSAYTSGSPLTIAGGVRTKITINGLGTATRTTFLPKTVSKFWDTDTIYPNAVGDIYECRLDLSCVTAGSNRHFDIELQVAVGNVIFAHTVSLTKGAGTEMNFAVAMPLYVGNTFLANGAQIYITPTNPIDFYDMGIMISRTSNP